MEETQLTLSVIISNAFTQLHKLLLWALSCKLICTDLDKSGAKRILKDSGVPGTTQKNEQLLNNKNVSPLQFVNYFFHFVIGSHSNFAKYEFLSLL